MTQECDVCFVPKCSGTVRTLPRMILTRTRILEHEVGEPILSLYLVCAKCRHHHTGNDQHTLDYQAS